MVRVCGAEKMRRYWIEASMVEDDEVCLEGDVLHHIRDVCRQRVGDKFEVLWGDGYAYFVEIISEKRNESRARILEKREVPGLAEPYINLALCFPRPAIMDAVVEKMVELGVQSVAPLISAQSFWKTQDDVISKKLERLERIVWSATQQSGRAELMRIDTPQSLRTMVETLAKRMNQNADVVGLFLYEGAGTQPIRDALRGLKDVKEVWVLIGGEGGFSLDEVKWIESQGLKALTLGPQVLRVETACVATISVIKYELGLMS